MAALFAANRCGPPPLLFLLHGVISGVGKAVKKIHLHAIRILVLFHEAVREISREARNIL